VVDTAFACENGGYAQKEEVAAGNEGVWRSVGGLLLIHDYGAVGKRIAPQPSDKRHIHVVPRNISLARYLLCHLHLYGMSLSVAEGQSLNAAEMFLCPKQASCTVLSATKNYYSFFLIFHDTFLLLLV
jgi:hypothetical protein